MSVVKTSHRFSTKNNQLEKNESEPYVQAIWSPCIGEPFETLYKEDNIHKEYAVAVHLNNCLTVAGHIPREITRTCHFFIKNRGEITGEVSGRQQHCTAACGGVEQ